MDTIVFLILRRMRTPLLVLIVTYAVTIAGLALIPGEDGAGNATAPMSIFHAFYFLSYTATTIGFGEIPSAFSDGQRLWASLTIYASVVAWIYSIGTLIALLQDRTFQRAIMERRFARRISRIAMPFHLVCGYGETGADGRYTLLPVCCLGNCDKGPTLMIDDDTHGPVAPADVPALLERYT